MIAFDCRIFEWLGLIEVLAMPLPWDREYIQQYGAEAGPSIRGQTPQR